MEHKVMRENIVLEVALTVKVEGISRVVESQKINLRDCLTFQAKHITYSLSSYNNSYNRHQSSWQNVVLFNIQKTDQSDTSSYKIKLSCPEFNITEQVFYSDDSQWRVMDENTKTSTYTFTVTLQVEALTQMRFSILYEDENLTDFKLKVKDGEISIHKAFLASVSTVFRSKLVDGNEINEDTLYISETSARTLRDFKKSIYTEVLPEDNLEELLLLASYFKINWLEFKCADKMMKNMSSGNAINLLEFALKHRHMPLFLGIMDLVQCGGIKMNEIRKHYMQL